MYGYYGADKAGTHGSTRYTRRDIGVMNVFLIVALFHSDQSLTVPRKGNVIFQHSGSA